MAKQIAVAGKGGSGKTTFAALLIRYLVKNNKGSILAVDADANANLNEALGMEVTQTISELISSTKDPRAIPVGMTQETYIEFKLQASLAESDYVDMLVMGGPEGPGCYCFPNNLLRGYMEKLGKNYGYVVMDNEAGLEHISRRVTQDIDYMFVVSDTSARGIRSAGRVRQLVDSIKSDVKNIYLVLTKTQNDEDVAALKSEIDKTGLTLIGVIPYDPLVAKFDLLSQPLYDLPEQSAAVQAVNAICKEIQI
ncbi:MAG TPA: AAA family ATPase [Methylomusa anaerophila]|uniref:CobQ/CobB/MinD/ParA nucleotide binding domain protein n=1 Tax=Methylomusa anaerophila TaxID=1930071 RepID=A0A348AFJ1_9FIRM|nr:AAA family ATPase [Methylomusa anaerophila]BBB89839.1 CobQ/CobB/MinD/ParA nucleotide binding domain protein [Methylomusa anaerophila]HML89115.1 AAA family ATPase [Methylomusa anaerophila]